MPRRLNDVCEENHLDPEKVQKAQSQMIDGLAATHLARAFKGLSDPSRIRMVSALSAGEISVYDLASIVGMTQSAVSHQLATLRDSGLVTFRKTGRKVYYALQDEHVIDVFETALRYEREKRSHK